jgi:hypothetical protein
VIQPPRLLFLESHSKILLIFIASLIHVLLSGQVPPYVESLRLLDCDTYLENALVSNNYPIKCINDGMAISKPQVESLSGLV